MGISAAMSTKERKQILDGLIAQGAVYVRDGKRGAILNLRGGKRFIVPVGTSDYKARLAMRAEIKRAGYQWPLEPDEKKENTTMTPAASQYPTDDDDLMPSAVAATIDAPPAREAWDVIAPYLTEFADREFWTDEFTDRIPANTSGFQNRNAAMRRSQQMLWFSGFRVTERKVNRNGWSYRWRRNPDTPWPTKFAMTAAEKVQLMNEANIARRATTRVDVPKPAPPKPKPIVQPAPPSIETPPVTAQDQDDAELSLAAEQEARALKAERLLAGVRIDLDNEKSAHSQTRRELLVRIARAQQRAEEQEQEIERLRSLLAERDAEKTEAPATGDSVLSRARRAEAEVVRLAAVVEQYAEQLSQRAAETSSPVASGDWWPLEATGSQTIEEVMRGARLYGLTVRVQARRS